MSEELEKKNDGALVPEVLPIQKNQDSPEESANARKPEICDAEEVHPEVVEEPKSPATEETSSVDEKPRKDPPKVEEPKKEEPKQAEPIKPEPEEQEPQVVVEKGFAYYVGFALLFVLGLILFFVPGIAITFGVNRLVELPATAAWIFSAILSVILWIIFKIKIKGFKKSFYWFIGFGALIVAAFVAIDVAVEGHGLRGVWNMMTGNTSAAELSAQSAAEIHQVKTAEVPAASNTEPATEATEQAKAAPTAQPTPTVQPAAEQAQPSAPAGQTAPAANP